VERSGYQHHSVAHGSLLRSHLAASPLVHGRDWRWEPLALLLRPGVLPIRDDVVPGVLPIALSETRRSSPLLDQIRPHRQIQDQTTCYSNQY
jgi:hypothetical protein